MKAPFSQTSMIPSRIYLLYVVATALGFVLGRSSAALAYNYPGVRWKPGNEITEVCYYLTRTTKQEMSELAIESADNRWDGAGAAFRFKKSSSQNCKVVKQDGVKMGGSYVNSESNSTKLWEPGVQADAEAQQYRTTADPTYYISRAIMRFRRDQRHFIFGTFTTNSDCIVAVGSRGVPRVDTWTTALHEFGHFLHLGHSSDALSIMSDSLPLCNGSKVLIRRDLASDDVAGINHIYP